MKHEPFCIDDRFFTGIEDYIDYFELELDDLDDDWFEECQSTTKRPMFNVSENDLKQMFVDWTDKHEDEFPEESDRIFKELEAAIIESVDLDKLNSLIPELYYPNQNKFKITKQDIIEYLK